MQHERAPRCYQYRRDSPELGVGGIKDDGRPPMEIHPPFPPPPFMDRTRYMNYVFDKKLSKQRK